MGVAPVDPERAGRLIAFLDRMALEPQNLTAIEDPAVAVDVHLADSLSGLVLPALRDAATIVDIGSGGGFPGVPLAMYRPECAVTLVESERRKADWLARATAALPNVRVVADRSETLAGRARERWEVATARAVAPLPVLLELAAPLVAVGGSLVAWRARRDPDEEVRGARVAQMLGFGVPEAVTVDAVPGAERHLLRYPKVAAAPHRVPRRPGRAAKRPLA